MPKVISAWQAHCERWKDGCGADICRRANKVCLARGKLPCDVVFLGEAPGESEDEFGVPMVGPAGQLFDRVIARAVPDGIRWCITNIVGCIPKSEDGDKASQPLPEDVRACTPRLQELMRIADPRLIVCVGTVARDYTDPKMHGSVRFHKPIPRVEVDHPAFIMRQPAAAQGLRLQRCVVTIANAIEEHCSAQNR